MNNLILAQSMIPSLKPEEGFIGPGPVAMLQGNTVGLEHHYICGTCKRGDYECMVGVGPKIAVRLSALI